MSNINKFNDHDLLVLIAELTILSTASLVTSYVLLSALILIPLKLMRLSVHAYQTE